MSYNQYSGNPYGEDNTNASYNNTSTTYAQNTSTYGASGYGTSNPYGDSPANNSKPGPNDLEYLSPAQQQATGYSQTSEYGTPTPANTNVSGPPAPGAYAGPPTVLSNQDFLKRVEGVRSELRQLTSNVSEIGSIHQRILSSPDTQSNSQLDNIISRTQILNTHIKDQIKQLEVDAAKSNKNTTKDSQIRTLKGSFKAQLEEYQQEEQTYRQRYKEQIARQYRIVNPDASEDEVQQATQADWGDEGVFQSALKSNRSGAANSVLGSVRARHNDIKQIERTLEELSLLFSQLAEQVALQDDQIAQVDDQTKQVVQDQEAGNKQLDRGIVSARRARKLKWWCFWIVVLICVIVALAVGLAVGLNQHSSSS